MCIHTYTHRNREQIDLKETQKYLQYASVIELWDFYTIFIYF